MRLAIDECEAVGIGRSVRDSLRDEDRKRFATRFAGAPKLMQMFAAIHVWLAGTVAYPFTAIVHCLNPCHMRQANRTP